ncbi:MAG: hypothetical protein H7X83_07120 [Verrucomicrobia bacterium]|nr:hypothetical protein [Deltaproteobacteria bacterium]
MPEGIILRTPGLPQSKIACDEKHHNNNTNDVKNIVHVNFSFLSFLGVVVSSTTLKLILIIVPAYDVPTTLGKQEVVIYPIIKVG